MRIKEAFPDILERQYPVVKPEYPLLTALYLLRMKDVDAVPITSLDGKSRRVLLGSSSLARLMTLGPKDFGDLLRGPCEDASDEVLWVSAEEDLRSLFEAFGWMHLGFAMVHGVEAVRRRSLVSLADVLELYGSRAIRTNMAVDDVATPIFSMPRETPIQLALEAMIGHGYRRVFLSGEEAYISDRGLMSYILSPTILEELGRDVNRDILATPIGEVEKEMPRVVAQEATLRAAARKLREHRGGCLVTHENKVVTRWDVVMKPWVSGRLKISARSSEAGGNE